MTGEKQLTDDEIIRTVSDDLPVGVWVARAPKGEFVYANKMFAEIMGMAARNDVAVGEYAQPYGICTRAGEPYPEDKMPFVRALLARETVVVDDIVIHRSDGRKVNIRAQARPVFEKSGEMSHIVIAFIDITREVVAESARVESEHRLHRGQRLESIGNLAGGIAHDFNNLLATIRMAASTLQLRETDPNKREALALIDQVTESGTHLTRSLLGFAGRGKHLAAPLHLNDVVRSVGELFRRTLDRRIEVKMDLTNESDVVMGDFSQLEQVVMNLAVNARDAIPDAGAITFRTWRSQGSGEDSIVLEVSDTGTGIDPAIHHRIFEPYFTTKTSGPVRGTGLGLATVYGIVESHRGIIQALGNKPRGTTMQIHLPAAPHAVLERPVDFARRREAVRGSGLILLAEDEPYLRDAVSSGLMELGYEVVAAADGSEAVTLFERHARKLTGVVLDMVMPKLGGHDAYVEMRKINAKVPVLLTTGYAKNEEAQRILDLGVGGFLPKPYDVAALSEALSRLIQR